MNYPATLTAGGITVGTALPPMTIHASTTFVATTAIATRDFQDVHHDRDAAHARGSKDIFVNILTDNGLVQKYVTDWAGPEAFVRNIAIRLGAPCYAGDTLHFSGTVTEIDGAVVTIAVTAKGALGDHISGTATVELPA
ncbi:beta-hydroxyacyl-ACP dehydratase [Tsukamurella pulmonis]|uniref:MaoC like domain-containing protein n=1 Tax=Tsukamurella pulmonis TaxID=47312 RepID=A0A1H1BHS5_9ACTN|nr:MaoC family dehydratase [Tsukamurella pulmonis]KXO90336.1 acyl dehydratase [Tsukamurella pulmonis]RDH09673.1 acyl dehydratase [Tsukamurella pulmonis]SDQ51421.1 MaoC like domain-containing protein [Tsukamurella pulmonis]SUP25155.1 (3R)-hydroxyacyl-ACP dehydratase subunit HadB [Tsukamurella pulmonis]BDD84435.1 beta-hydroxyacyl-ACP dehydratase [Tsukamurella pulmonis]